MFGFPEVAIGILPSRGGTVRAARLLGAARAKQLILLGERIPAARALELGLVTEVVAEGTHLERALELARALAELPAAALSVAKQAIDAAAESSRDTALLVERLAYGLLAQTTAARRRPRASAELSVEHAKEIEIRWSDLDVYGHVNHVVFLTYLEEARDEWLGAALGDPSLVWSFVVARVEIDYRRELTLADDVVVATCAPSGSAPRASSPARPWRPAAARSRPLRRRSSSRGTSRRGRSRPLAESERAAFERALA